MNRSYLMVSAQNEKHLDKLETLNCDVAMINLEDGVFDKKKARELLVKKFLKKTLKFNNKKTVVRVNSINTCGKEDIQAINSLKPNAIRVPKIYSIEDIQTALSLVDNDIELHLSIETKESFEQLSKLKIDKRVTTVYLGILDLLESFGLPQEILTLDNPTIDYILSKFLIDSKIAGFEAVSFIFQDYKDLDTFEKWCKKEKSMGFNSKGVISPSQVEIANTIFKIDDKIIEKAQYIKTIFEKAQKNKNSSIIDEKYGFIDEPIYKNALLILKRCKNDK